MFGSALAGAPAAEAATFPVDTTDDGDDGSCFNGDCTLREAAEDASTTDGDDVITFTSGVTGDIELSSSLGNIGIFGDSLEIQGPGADVLTVSGEGDTRIFKLFGVDAPNDQVTISGLTLANGFGEQNDFGGGEVFGYGGGAIYNDDTLTASYAADLTVADSVLTNNRTTTAGDSGEDGGAIRSQHGDVTITNSIVSNNTALYDGGGLSVYDGSLTIAGSTISDNTATLYDGGGVRHITGTLQISGSTFSGNSAGFATPPNDFYGAGGAVYGDEVNVTIDGSQFSGNYAGDNGGAIAVEDTLGTEATEFAVADSVFAANEVITDGGGLYLDSIDGAALIERSTFSQNTTVNDGAAIYLDDGGDAPVTIRSSTLSGNQASDDGSGLYSDPDGGGIVIRNPVEPVTIENTTVSGNSAGDGGGIWVDGDDEEDDAEVTIRNSTVAGNSALETGGGIFRDAYEVAAQDNATDEVNLSSTIVANNSAAAGPDVGDDPDIETGASAFVTAFSLVENGAGAAVSESPAGSNILGVDPLLGPLAANGGPTETHLPAFNSPALDKGIANGLANDQRGLARTQELSAIANATGGDGTDIGAVELQAGDCQGASVPKLDGTAGDDTLTGSEGPDAIAGLAGNDAASGAGGDDCVSGDDGKDNVKGGAGKDLISGGAGKDKTSGNGGKDKVKGQAGKDNLKGGGGKDRLAGAGGKDKLSGGGGKDRLKGGPGKDKLKGGGGKDRFNCGGGKDKVTAQAKDKVSASCEKVIEKG